MSAPKPAKRIHDDCVKCGQRINTAHPAHCRSHSCPWCAGCVADDDPGR